VAVVEDGEELTVAGEAVGQPCPGQGVGEVVGGKAGLALLAVGDVRFARGLEALGAAGRPMRRFARPSTCGVDR